MYTTEKRQQLTWIRYTTPNQNRPYEHICIIDYHLKSNYLDWQKKKWYLFLIFNFVYKFYLSFSSDGEMLKKNLVFISFYIISFYFISLCVIIIFFPIAATVILVAASAATLVLGQQQGEALPFPESVPETTFSCADRPYGYYADVEANCQVFHICHNNAMWSFLCPNQTLFNQVKYNSIERIWRVCVCVFARSQFVCKD